MRDAQKFNIVRDACELHGAAFERSNNLVFDSYDAHRLICDTSLAISMIDHEPTAREAMALLLSDESPMTLLSCLAALMIRSNRARTVKVLTTVTGISEYAARRIIQDSHWASSIGGCLTKALGGCYEVDRPFGWEESGWYTDAIMVNTVSAAACHILRSKFEERDQVRLMSDVIEALAALKAMSKPPLQILETNAYERRNVAGLSNLYEGCVAELERRRAR